MQALKEANLARASLFIDEAFQANQGSQNGDEGTRLEHDDIDGRDEAVASAHDGNAQENSPA